MRILNAVPLLAISETSVGILLRRTHRTIPEFSSKGSYRGLSTLGEMASSTVDSEKSKFSKQTVAVVGSGAIGAYYGARLWEAGHCVKFLFRGENYHVATENGLTVHSIDGDIHIPKNQLEAYQSTLDMGKVDWVLVALKTTGLSSIPELIYPLLDPERTRVIAAMNGLIENDLIRIMKDHTGQENVDGPLQCCHSLYGGMAFVCSNRLSPGVVQHTYAGLLEAGVACTQAADLPAEEAAYRALWKDNIVKTDFTKSLPRSRWKKMCWNLPFNGISVAMGGITIDRVVGDPSLRELAYKAIDETMSIANAELEHLYGEGGFEPLGAEDREMMMWLADNAGEYRTSTMLDLIGRRSMEVEYMFQKPLQRARALNVTAPCLETLVAQIEAFQRYHNLY